MSINKNYCPYCVTCINDCKRISNINHCDNYHKAKEVSEYIEIIKDLNVNLKRLCNEKKLKYHILLDMLNCKRLFLYKYRYILEQKLYEKDIFLPYIDSEVVED